MINNIFLLLGIGVIISFIGIGSLTAFAQEDEASTMEVTFSIITTVIGFIIVLIPIIRRELIARNVQNPAITQLLNQVESLTLNYQENQEKLLQMSEIAYDGLSKTPQGKEFVDNIENKEKVKLIQLQKDAEAARLEAEKFLALYTSLKPAVKNDQLKTTKVVESD